MQFPPNEDPAIQAAVRHLLDLYRFARPRQRSTTCTLLLVAISDHTDEYGDNMGAALLAGLDSTEAREAAIGLIRDIPANRIN